MSFCMAVLPLVRLGRLEEILASHLSCKRCVFAVLFFYRTVLR